MKLDVEGQGVGRTFGGPENYTIFMQPEIFQGRGGFVKLRHFNKHFTKTSRKKSPKGKLLEFFLLDTFKTTF